MRILGLPGGSGPCDYYRVERPLAALAEAGMAEVLIPPIKNGQRSVRVGPLTEEEKRQIIENLGPWDGFQEIRNIEKLPNVLDYDLVVFQRQGTKDVYRLIARAQTLSVKTVFDVDDDAFNIPATNPNYLLWGRDGRKIAGLYLHMREKDDVPPRFKSLTLDQVVRNAKELRDGLFRNMRSADLLTISTPALAAVYKRLRADIVVLPNQMWPEDWQGLEAIRHPGEVWLGWAGSKTHYDDLKLLERVVPDILERYPQVCFVIAGFPEVKKRLFEGYPDHRVITFPWTDIRGYRNYLASFDIVLAPSYPCTFNEGKSDIRILEAGMVGRPVVGSPTTYEATIRESGGGLVAKTRVEWVKALSRLIEDEALRKAMGQSLADYTRTYRTYQANVHLWAEAYSRLLEA